MTDLMRPADKEQRYKSNVLQFEDVIHKAAHFVFSLRRISLPLRRCFRVYSVHEHGKYKYSHPVTEIKNPKGDLLRDNERSKANRYVSF